MTKSIIYVNNLEILNLIEETKKKYDNLSKQNNKEIFWKDIFKLDKQINNTTNDWAYYHFKVKNYDNLIKDNFIVDYINWQLIEHYIIKLSRESQTENNENLTERIKEKGWIENYIKDRNKTEKNKWYKIKTQIYWEKSYWKETYVRIEDWKYLSVIFTQKEYDKDKKIWEDKWYEKNVKNMIDWYIWELLYWRYLYDEQKKWTIKSFEWENKLEVSFWKIEEDKNSYNYSYKLEVNYKASDETLYDYKIKMEKDWKIIEKYIDLKTLNINSESQKKFNYGYDSIWNWKFYVKLSNVLKDTNKKIIFLPIWYNKWEIFIFKWNLAPTSKQLLKDNDKIVENTKKTYELSKKWEIKEEFDVWKTKNIWIILSKIIRADKNWVWEIVELEDAKKVWKIMKWLKFKTTSWNSIENYVIFYWNYLKQFWKTMKKTK